MCMSMAAWGTGVCVYEYGCMGNKCMCVCVYEYGCMGNRCMCV